MATSDQELVAQIKLFGADGTSYAVAARFGEYRAQIATMQEALNRSAEEIATLKGGTPPPMVQVTAEIVNPGPPIVATPAGAAESPINGEDAGHAQPTSPPALSHDEAPTT